MGQVTFTSLKTQSKSGYPDHSSPFTEMVHQVQEFTWLSGFSNVAYQELLHFNSSLTQVRSAFEKYGKVEKVGCTYCFRKFSIDSIGVAIDEGWTTVEICKGIVTILDEFKID